MEFFNSAVDTLQTIVVGLGGALCVWGGINLLEGYGADNPASNAQTRGTAARTQTVRSFKNWYGTSSGA